jgi:hypothetical protein
VKYHCCNEPEIMLFLVSSFFLKSSMDHGFNLDYSKEQPRNKVAEATSEVADTYPFGLI